MGLISFIKSAGEKIFGKKEEVVVDKAAVILGHIRGYGFDTSDVQAQVTDDLVILTGKVDSIANKNRIIVAAGNVEGIAKVEDRLVVLPKGATIPMAEIKEPEEQYYTVVPGDSLSKIAKKYYGNANKYPVIFEANTPMLKHPDKIYPGQVLVIPPVE
ncbi:MAG TPA: peptidoglycan-binding protein LysM [Prolixibacteraceae bacterium]|nr:peptidoglycan-binding protein LysM [Prolixibacteraceae bacterium]HPT31320.1 peptidoglycan-binding protein LysM [Prolixibacteraceae bacterium]